MSERKVLNKYYPPDFDPSKIPRGRKAKNNQVTVRMMLPMSVRCTTCGEYLYKGKKFNSKKETVVGEEYLGVKIFRFYMRCTNCSAEFTIKTDPENSDYLADLGCSRNFEPWRQNEKLVEEVKKAREQEEEGDTMKALENRTVDSKVEMDIIEALDEIRALNARNSKVTSDQVMEAFQKRVEEEDRLPDDDEQMLKEVIFRNSALYVKRLEVEEDLPKKKKQKVEVVPQEKKEESGFISVLSLPDKSGGSKVVEQKKKPLVKFTPKIVVNGGLKNKAAPQPLKESPAESTQGSLVDYMDDGPTGSLVDY